MSNVVRKFQNGVSVTGSATVNGGAVFAPQIKVNNTTVSTNTTVATVSDFTFAAAASSKYLLEYFLFVHSDGQATLRFKPDYPTGIVKTYAGTGGPQSSGSAALSETVANGTQIGQYISTQAGDYTIGVVTIYVETGATAGNIVFKYSSHTGTFGEVRAGSFVRITTF
jgi:hypothetical protein